MAPSVKVKFDKNVYYPGENVAGKVCINNSKPRKSEGITVTFKGHAEVMIIRSTSRAENQHHHAAEDYYKKEISVWHDASHTLPAGRQEFPFSFELPHGVPPSFRASYGKVEHFCKVKLDLKHSLDVKLKQFFTVLSGPLPEDEMAIENEPQSRYDDTLAGHHGEVTTKVELNATRYTPGEHIVIDALIVNKTDKKLTGTSAVLYMTVKYRSGRSQQYAIASKELGPVAPHSEQSWEQEEIAVPRAPASGLPGCGIIDVFYGLKFTVDRKLPATSLILDFPIVIGTPNPDLPSGQLSPLLHLAPGASLGHRDSLTHEIGSILGRFAGSNPGSGASTPASLSRRSSITEVQHSFFKPSYVNIIN